MSPTLPALFVSHGSPTILRDPVPARDFLLGLGKEVGEPRAVLCVSAHWCTRDPAVTASPSPRTIHDFYGFPAELYREEYGAPGDPALARRVASLLSEAGIPCGSEERDGLDHGAWVPLKLMYPDGRVPVVQLSVQPLRDPAFHLAVGEALRPLRDEGVLLLGSGGATHNLRALARDPREGEADPRAAAFDRWLARAVEEGDREGLSAYLDTAPHGGWNHPTPEHFLPLFAPLGAGGRGRRIHGSFTFSVLSMAAFAWD